ncbi:hypothetical protein P3X46_032465 [Hevea brasiliensis]|uniref:RING-type E3 ubiquitin transferase n=1 Tax=Hevea brasiliensis TaxID=3981 RepID=A0ABQ9KGG1_HEVBR|nr:hypothetical protein P3X46_032465 [Hevea brasiliensis]
MEFQEALMRLIIHKPVKKGFFVETHKQSEKQKWKVFSFRRLSKQEIPREFLCPICEYLMNDPVIVSSGHSFERSCVQACNSLAFIPTLMDGTIPDFSTVIPNLALKSAILNWCNKNSVKPPQALDFFSAEKLVRAKMDAQQEEKGLIQRIKQCPSVNFMNQAAIELTLPPSHLSSSSEESVDTTASTPPLQFTTRPGFCPSSSSSSEMETLNLNSNPEVEELITKLKSPQVFEIEEAVISLRKITRTKEDTRVELCTPRLLSVLRSLINSRYTNIQVNSTACLVNLSLEKVNKVKIVRSGIVPALIDVLKGGFPEAKEHACGSIFSLALEDHNKTAIGVLGALPPLLHLLRSESEWTRHDSALALYHLSLVQSNRTKLIKLGAVPILLGLIKSGHMRNRVLLILCSLASCLDGQAAMLDSGGVDCLLALLRDNELESESTRESCVSVLFALSHCGLRFTGLAKAAGAVEVFSQLENSGREQTKEKARRLLEMMKSKEEEEKEQVNWEELLDSG